MIIQKPGFTDYYEKCPTQVTHISNAKDNRNHRQLSSQCFIRIETLCFAFDNDNNDLEITHPKSVFSYSIIGRIGIWKCCFLRRGENRSNWRKTSRSKGENQRQTQPRWEATALTTAPSLACVAGVERGRGQGTQATPSSTVPCISLSLTVCHFCRLMPPMVTKPLIVIDVIYRIYSNKRPTSNQRPPRISAHPKGRKS